ncbi:MAG TPA: DALR anticodon-binding domain-containing protein, partial [Bacillota bacterium]|nr:DALR anticodon-binding domain-containing protein [Bacillota bacterium]
CSLLNHPTETALVRRMSVFPDELWAAVEELQPSRMARYAYELAGEFHRFYTECRVVSEDVALSAARLALVDAVRITIANLLPLMGISAPERM